jgi:rhamnopyranosyl-N-acetylglucosaminyl-diphospho-decaprenol beta-1,3/1,4-galactofuranosyltransferase
MKPTVCAIVVTYNRLETLKIAFAHLLAQTTQPDCIVIVDNCSCDGTQSYLREISGHQPIYCLFMSSNTGPAGAIAEGMNFALKQEMYDYLWVVDDDTFYAPNALSELLETIQQTDYVMLGLHGAQLRMGAKVYVDPAIRLQQVDYAMIDGALIKTSVVKKMGPLCKEFVMMCEDHEYSLRLRKHGYKLGVLKNGADDRQLLGGGGKFTSSTLWRGYYSARNHTFIIRKYFSIKELFAYAYHQWKLLVVAAVFAPDRLKRVKFRLLGIWHGIRGISGKTLDPGTMKFTSS